MKRRHTLEETPSLEEASQIFARVNDECPLYFHSIFSCLKALVPMTPKRENTSLDQLWLCAKIHDWSRQLVPYGAKNMLFRTNDWSSSNFLMDGPLEKWWGAERGSPKNFM